MAGFLFTFVFLGKGANLGILDSGSKSESESLSIFLEFCLGFETFFDLLQFRELFGCFFIGHEHLTNPGFSGLFSFSGLLLRFCRGWGSSVAFFFRPGIFEFGKNLRSESLRKFYVFCVLCNRSKQRRLRDLAGELLR